MDWFITDEILWYELSENTPVSATQSTQHIGELANALQILHHYKEEWSEDDIVSIIDELTSKSQFSKFLGLFSVTMILILFLGSLWA